MHCVVTISEAVQRAKGEGFPISECALRRWIKTGQIPVRKAGNKNLLYYPSLVSFLKCETGCDNAVSVSVQVPGVRRVEV